MTTTSVSRFENAKEATETLNSERGQPSTTASARETDHQSEERIRERAYLIWIEEGQPEGRADEHWQRARQEMEHDAR